MLAEMPECLEVGKVNVKGGLAYFQIKGLVGSEGWVMVKVTEDPR